MGRYPSVSRGINKMGRDKKKLCFQENCLCSFWLKNNGEFPQSLLAVGRLNQRSVYERKMTTDS